MSDKVLIAKGYAPTFKMKEGGTVRCGRSSAVLHDETGRMWPSCSGLIVPRFVRTRREIRDKAAEAYFGEQPLLGELSSLPPKSLGSWRLVGLIDELTYRRTGKHAGGFYHPIEKGTAKLYRLRGMHRVELGRGCVWNWRGIVKP